MTLGRILFCFRFNRIFPLVFSSHADSNLILYWALKPLLWFKINLRGLSSDQLKLKTNILWHFKWICPTKCLNWSPGITTKRDLNGNWTKLSNYQSFTCDLALTSIWGLCKNYLNSSFWHIPGADIFPGVDTSPLNLFDFEFHIFPMQIFLVRIF